MRFDCRIVGDAAHLGQCTDESAVGVDPDRVQSAEMRDVDEPVRFGNAGLGKVEQGRSAGENHGRGERGRAPRLVDRAGAKIRKVPHDIASAASRTAATMCG